MYSKVKPTVGSDPKYFRGEEREAFFNNYDERGKYVRVNPTKGSESKFFKVESEWRGISDFVQRQLDLDQKAALIRKIEPVKEQKQIPRRSYNASVTLSYPNSDKFEYVTEIHRINFDEERKNDFNLGRGIKIEKPQGVKKDVKDPNSIYSPEFGPTFDDANSYGSRHSCQCGYTKTQQNEGTKCPICGTTVVRKDDDFTKCGWIILENDWVIHAGLYKSIEFFIGKTQLTNILDVKDEKDENGFSIKVEREEEDKYYDYGMIGFREHFDEIMDFYLKLNPNKKEYYDDIMSDRDKVFTHSIPVFTTLLRPYHLNGDKFAFQDTNKYFNMMAMLGAILNYKDAVRARRAKKTRNQLLYNIQCNIMEIYDEVIKIMSSKKGIIRSLYGGKFNFSCRAVIVPNWTLRTDQIKLPFKTLVKLLEHSIINILHNTYGMAMHTAKAVFDKAYTDYDERVWKIVNYLIKANNNGIPFLINRNPTLSYGSILQMFCIGISGNDPENYTMEIPLLILPLLNADFDGDLKSVLFRGLNNTGIGPLGKKFSRRNTVNCWNILKPQYLYENIGA